MKTFKLSDGNTIAINQDCFPSLVFQTIANQVGNRCIEMMTVREFYTTKWLLAEGWKAKPNFYGYKTPDRGTALKANFTWFAFNGIHRQNITIDEYQSNSTEHYHQAEEVLSFVMNINHNTNELWLYDACDGEDEPHLMAKFDCYADFKKCIKDFDDYVPVIPLYVLSVIPSWNPEIENPFVSDELLIDKLVNSNGLEEGNNDEYFVPWVVDKDNIVNLGDNF